MNLSLIKKHKIIAAVIGTFLCAVIGLALTVFILSNPFKIKDPSDSRFDPMKFQFEDYPYKGITVFDVIQKMFPIGTSQEFIDKVLVDSAGAEKTVIPMDKRDYWYQYYPQKGNWKLFQFFQLYRIFFFEISWDLGFDYEDGRLKQIYPGAGCMEMIDMQGNIVGCQDQEWMNKWGHK